MKRVSRFTGTVLGLVLAAGVHESNAQDRVKLKVPNKNAAFKIAPELEILLAAPESVELRALAADGDIVVTGASRNQIASTLRIQQESVREIPDDSDDGTLKSVDKLIISFNGPAPSAAALEGMGFTAVENSVRIQSGDRGMMLVRPRKMLNRVAARSLIQAVDSKIIITAEPEVASYRIPKKEVLDPKPVQALANRGFAIQSAATNDPLMGQLWGLENIHAETAWTRSFGDKDFIVAVIDTGVDYNHEDLKSNMWINPNEKLNGRDDDGNGLIDDIHGWDFVSNGTGDNDPMDDHGHGTHCAGTIAAVRNNGKGIVGVAPQARIMALKILDREGFGRSRFHTIQAIDYAVNKGAKVISASFGSDDYSIEVKSAIDRAMQAGVIFVAAAGNSTVDISLNENRTYPAGYGLPNIIAVGATERGDVQASFSNWSANNVDLGAPGQNIVSCAPGNKYVSMNGTSMATPHVAGAVAMVFAAKQTKDWEDVRNFLFQNTRQVPALKNSWGHNSLINRPGAVLDIAAVAQIPPSGQVSPVEPISGGGESGGTVTPPPSPVTLSKGTTQLANFPADTNQETVGHRDLACLTITLKSRSKILVTANTSVMSRIGNCDITSLVSTEPIDAAIKAKPDQFPGLAPSRRFLTVKQREWTNFGTQFETELGPGTHKLFWSVYVHPLPGEQPSRLRFDAGSLAVTQLTAE